MPNKNLALRFHSPNGTIEPAKIVQDGFAKAAMGITSIEEVMRVTKE